MTERPILFSGAMVRAILEGRKTVTRRLVKPQPSLPTTRWWPANGHGPQWMADGPSEATGGTRQTWGWKVCPFGQPGDRLWVRESTEADYDTHDAVVLARYCADKAPVMYWDEDDGELFQAVDHWSYPRDVRPSIHMNRAQARILLEITAVRVERLQDISEEQALAEGVKCEPCDHTRQACTDIGCWGDTAKGAFGFLWESLNGAGSWAANPWVWVVEFKRVTP